MKFDTRDKKPKLYALFIPITIAAAVISAMMICDAERYAAAICFVMAALCLVVIGMLLWAFREQLRYNPYSYNTIFYIGFALFVFSILITNVNLALEMIRYPELKVQEAVVLHVLLDSAKQYMFFTSPFLLVFSAALCISNIALIRHEGRRVVNILGIILSFLLVGGLLFLFKFDYYASGIDIDLFAFLKFLSVTLGLIVIIDRMLFIT